MLLLALAIWMLISGLDDLLITVVYLLARRPPVQWPSEADLDARPERPIAILVPLWHEHRVIRRMLEHNVAAIRYSNYHIFAGVYPNDPATLDEIPDHPRVHPIVGPHNGPTSKGDCLHWLFQAVQTYEHRCDVRFQILITHDAEDLVHPESLRLLNWFSADYGMVQIPVLPLPTPIWELTHGLYCDEFAEFQTKDLPVRQRLNGFVPSNGVGTGFGRVEIERLAAQYGRIFDPACLTEDYENGLRLADLGCRQLFVPLRTGPQGPVATREYFPRRFRAAVRQRSRWVAGICLQGWERHGFLGSLRHFYWLWRDRKGLVGNLLSPIANVFLFYGLTIPNLKYLWWTNLGLSAIQMGVRALCCARIYGWTFAAGVPVRVLWGNLINFLATLSAIRQFAAARARHRSLAWRKTDHSYPKPRLGEVLIRMNCLALADLEDALVSCPKGIRIGEHLIQLQKLREEELYQALSAQAGIPLGPPDKVDRPATRALPRQTVRRWRLLPYKVAKGQIYIVSTEVPTDEMLRELAQVSSLELRFRLVRPADFEKLAGRFS